MINRIQYQKRATCLSIVLLSLLFTSLVDAEVRVTRITDANVGELRREGPDAIGGVGDYFLGNGTLCAIVSSVDHETDLSSSGGTLVDVGFCGRADDHYVSKQDLLDASRSAPVNIHRVEIAQGKETASILTIGGSNGLLVEIRYTVSANAPAELAITRRILRRHDEAPNPGMYAPITFNYASLLPFVFSSMDLSRSSGFEHTLFFTRGASAIPEAAQAADTIILVTPPHTEVPISYGWQLAGARRISGDNTKALPHFALADTGALAFVVPTDEFWVGDGSELSMLQLLQVPLLGLDVGDVLEIDERILIGRNGTVAAITDQLFAEAPKLVGQVVGEMFGTLGKPRSGVHIDLPDGTPVTSTTLDVEGHFAVRVPTGNYRLRVLGPADAHIEKVVSVMANGGNAGRMMLPEVANIRLPRGEAVRLVFRGQGTTSDPNLDDTHTGFVEHGGRGIAPIPAVFLAGIASDPEFVALAPGRYRVYATRGIEYSVTHADIDVMAGAVIDLPLALPERVVSSPQHIAADLHVHASPSMDNAFPVMERVRTFVAEHAEVMVAAEHETVFDFEPVVAAMGLKNQLVVVTGTEMTSEVRTARMPWTAGHANFFPVRYQPNKFRRGAPHNEDRRLREVLADVRSANPGVITQLNHARSSDELSGELPDDYALKMQAGAYLDHLGIGTPYRPDKPLEASPNMRLIERDPSTGVRDIDFDAMELMNGTFDHNPTRTQTLRKDWFSLMRQGVVLTGTANSDSHGKSQQVGLPRNMVRVRDDALKSFDVNAFAEALRSGASYGTTGPLLDVKLGDAELGGLHIGRQGTLNGRVYCPDWIDAFELRVQVDGHTVHTEGLAEDGSFSVPLRFEGDAFVTLEVFGDASEIYAAVYPGHRPYAFTNPVFVDADGDGKWTAPGFELP
ncbi:MAG: hypothetical protein ACI96P_001263 [Candidatus Azotimanducaceae bacterium]|jgi:hypothetical protein